VGAPVNGVPRQSVFRSVHRLRHPTCPSARSARCISHHRLTWLASAPFRARHCVRYPAGYHGPRPGVRADRCPRVPAAFRPPAFASRPSFPAWSSAPLTIGLPPPARSPPADHDGVSTFRTPETRPDWAPSLPRDQRCSHGPYPLLARRMPSSSGTVLSPGETAIYPGFHITGRQRGFKRFARPAFPSPATPG
jgi:hypothetical protein